MPRRDAALLLVLVLGGCAAPHEDPEAKPLVAVTVARAELADVPIEVRASALVHPRQVASISSRITAPIQALLVGKGEQVAAGAIIVRLDSRDLVAQREDVLAALRQAEALGDRRGHLFAEGAIPERDLLTAQTELAQAKARLEVSNTQLTFSELRTPFAGRVTEQFLYPGDMAQPGTPIFTVADTGTAIARAQLPQAETAKVRAAQACAFVPADAPAESFAGHVTVVNPAIDPARRTLEAWCEIPNSDGRLLPGTFGEARIRTGLARSIVVPVGAVQLEEGTRKGSAFVVDAQKVAHHRDVEGGVVLDGKMQILSGLAAGDIVVVEGAYALPDGTTVRIAEPVKEPEKSRP
jgi:HlyD family secretion protein